MNNGLVSIIIPVFNCEKYIDQCLESATAQTYKNIEVILVNDGSGDDSLAKCREWEKKDGRIKVIDQENKGPSEARNAGLALCRGEYIQFFDADDRVSPEITEKLLDALLKNGADVSACSFYNVYEDRTLKASFPEKTIEGDEIAKAIFTPGFFQSLWNKLFKREVIFSKNGDFIRFDRELFISEDSFWLSSVLQNAKKAVYVDEPLYYWQRREDSLTKGSTKVRLDDKAMTEVTAMERIAENYKKLGPDAETVVLKKLFMIEKQKLFLAYEEKNGSMIDLFEGKIKKLLKEYHPENKIDKLVVLKFYLMRLLYKLHIPASKFFLFSAKPEFITKGSSMEEVKKSESIEK